MEKTKLNIVFHNPNTDEDTIKYLAQVFAEVSLNRVVEELGELKNSTYQNTESPAS